MTVPRINNSIARLAIVSRVIHKWRYPLWCGLSAHPKLEVHFFHGENLPNSKQLNAPDLSLLSHTGLKTRGLNIFSSGRQAPLVYHSGIANEFQKFSPDVILCEGGSNILTNVSIFRYAKKHNIPIIWWGLGELKGREYKGLISRLYLTVRYSQERRSSAYLGYSTQAVDYFLSRGYPKERCYCALNCLNTDAIIENIPGDKDRASQLRSELAVQDKRVILFCGTLIKAKRCDRLINAFSRLTSDYPNSVVLMVGDGPVRGELEELTNSLGLQGRIIFTGGVWDGVGSYFEMADFFVLPGLGGLAISEAMCHAKPVISAPADGTERDYIQQGKTGYVLTASNEEGIVDQLTDYMSNLLKSPEITKEMGLHARNFVDTQANVKNYSDKVVECVLETLSRSKYW